MTYIYISVCISKRKKPLKSNSGSNKIMSNYYQILNNIKYPVNVQLFLSHIF